MTEINNMMKSVQVGTVDFFGILVPGLLASITSLVGFCVPVFLFVWNISGASLPITTSPPVLWGFGLFLLLVFSYVLGYILRLSSPDELDKISARNVILRELDRLREHYEQHPEENRDKQDYKVKAWFRLILHYPTLRKLIKRIEKHAILAEE